MSLRVLRVLRILRVLRVLRFTWAFAPFLGPDKSDIRDVRCVYIYIYI